MNWAIDENVIAVANDIGRISKGEDALCPQADDVCRLACIEFLSDAIKNGKILLDAADIVCGFYRRKASMSGQPGSGDAFLRALFQVSHDPSRTIRVNLPTGRSFGLPNSFTSCGFDPDDFVYVALVRSQSNAAVANAVDSDYSIYAADLAAIGVNVVELCASCLKKA